MIDQNQDLAEKYFNSGIEKSKKDEYELAIEDYTKAIELKPDYAEAYYYRGYASESGKKQDQILRPQGK